MMVNRALIGLLLCLLPASAMAELRETLGWGRLFDNDAIGDLHDRWQSGAYSISLLQGPQWMGQLPEQFGSVLEYRLTGRTVTAANLSDPAPGDRRFAAPLSFGLHTHTRWQGLEASIGADLVAIGPQTGISGFQSWLHGVLGVAKPNLGDQFGNAFFPTLNAELGRSFGVTDTLTLRPFVSAEAGLETMVRAGGDLIIGNFGKGGLLLRDDTTGQRYRGIKGDETPGMSFTLGGDVAHVFSSALLPEGGGAVASETRGRLRAGLWWQGDQSSVFYGMTYLTPEFGGQSEGQIVGSLNLNLRF